jgi:hypothetical protein
MIAILGIIGQATAADQSCNANGELEFCIDSFETNKNTITKGNVAEGVVNVKNTGNKSGDVVIIIGLQDSEDTYKYHRVGVLHDIQPRETEQYEFQLQARDTTATGEHRANVRLMNPSENHLYDSTGYTTSVYIEEESVSIGWIIDKFNRITVGFSALLTVIAFLIGKRAN